MIVKTLDNWARFVKVWRREMAHYRYCVYTLHVFRFSCPTFSEALLAVHECSQLTCKFRENRQFRPEWIYVEIIIIIIIIIIIMFCHVFCTRYVLMLGLSGGEKVGLLILDWCAVVGGSTWKVAALKTEKPLWEIIPLCLNWRPFTGR